MTTDHVNLHVGDRLAELAASHPDRIQLVQTDPRGNESAFTTAELEFHANAAARALEAHGIHEHSTIGIALGSGFGHVTATLGAWKLGATVVPLNPRAGTRERHAIRQSIGGPVLGPADWADIPAGAVAAAGDGRGFPGRGLPRSASVTGGSTGLPRIIRNRRPWLFPGGNFLTEHDRLTRMRDGQVQLVVLPLYHAGFAALYRGLTLDHKIVLLERFTGRLFFTAIERHRVHYIRMVPFYMRAALDVPDIRSFDLSSLEAVNHVAAACPESVKRKWIDIIGPEKVFEDYACMERIGGSGWISMIRGDEWLRHPGSVGIPNCDIVILGEDGRPLRPPEAGVIYLRAEGMAQPQYIGRGTPLPEWNGFLSVGDVGHLDEHGYLYLTGRKGDVISTGGVDVYPAEVEAVLLDHGAVTDAAVVGVPHRYLGKALHAIVVPADPARMPTTDELDRHCRSALSASKVPLSYELRTEAVHADTGKLRRRDLTRRRPENA